MRRVPPLLPVLLMLWVQPAGAQTRLTDGVVRYDKPAAQNPSFWQSTYDRFGWLVKSRPFNRSVALLVGVGTYAHLSPQLTYVKSDLAAMREFLLGDGGFDRVYVMSDGIANAALVENYMFNVLPAELAPNDRLLFYFSGHGADIGGQGYMQFANASAAYDRDQYLDVTRTEQWSKRIAAKHILFLIDACNAGLGYTEKAGVPLDEGLLEQFAGKGSRNVITAGTGTQRAYQVEENKQGYSVFTRAFLDSIRGAEVQGGFLTLAEVMAGIERRVAAFSRDNQSKKMTPRRWDLHRSDDDLGTFVFVNPRATAPPLLAGLRQYINAVAKTGSDGDASGQTSGKTARLLVVVDAEASISVNGEDVGRVQPNVPRVVEAIPGQNLVQVTPVGEGALRTQRVDVPAGEQRIVDIKFIAPANLSVEVAMRKGGRPLSGREKQRIGEGYDGVVQSVVVSVQQAPPGLTLKREYFYMSDTGGSDGGGPIMQAVSTGSGDSRDRFEFPKGLRGVKFWLEGTDADKYSVNYEILLTNGVSSQARDGAPAGDWTPRTSSSQHQLVWLTLAIERRENP